MEGCGSDGGKGGECMMGFAAHVALALVVPLKRTEETPSTTKCQPAPQLADARAARLAVGVHVEHAQVRNSNAGTAHSGRP